VASYCGHIMLAAALVISAPGHLLRAGKQL
jgi:hypothetical protein